MKCPHCKRTIEEDSEFCIYCGSKVIPYSAEKEHKNKLPVIIAGIAGACIIATCACFTFLIMSYKQSSAVLDSVANEADVRGSSKEKTETDSGIQSTAKKNESQKNNSKTLDNTTNKASNSVPKKKTEEPQTTMESTTSSEYILPDSSQRVLADSEVSGLSKQELRLARNEIYARHGRRFDDQELQNYFNSKSWYSGTINPSDFSESLLSSTEKNNIDTIKKYEQ